MNIIAKITGLKYKPFCTAKLSKVDFNDFDINSRQTYFVTKNDNFSFSISKWKSPKRTRSYPFERVYNTLGFNKKITVIPIIKDEGKDGDRDYLQWDTLSLMSLLDVNVILANYNYAEKNIKYKNKATNFKFDNAYVKNKIIEISEYHSSPLHWNLKEIKETMPELIKNSIDFFEIYSKLLSVEFHGIKGIIQFKNKFLEGLEEFMDASRIRAKEAQNREILTVQPKEFLTTATKATITIKNYLGGIYYLTTDEVKIKDDILNLIESKHSRNSILPSLGDIKDGLLKMILYCNLKSVIVNGKELKYKPVLKLTSEKLVSNFYSDRSNDLGKFCAENNINTETSIFLKLLFDEANINNFDIIIESV